MLKGRSRVAMLCLLALLLGALPLLAACGDDEDKTPTAEEKEITIGATLIFSGPTASSTAEPCGRMIDTIRYLNEVEGGVDGIKIKFVYADDKYDAAVAATAFKRLRDQHHPLMWITFGDWLFMGVKDILERDRTPVVTFIASTPELYDPPGLFFAWRSCDANMFTGVIKWILEDWEASGGTGRPKLATLHWDNPYGNAHKIGDTYKWAEEQGVDIVERTYAPMALDLRSQLLHLRDRGVDYIYFGGMLSDAAVMVRDARATGIWDEIKIIHDVNLDSYLLVELSGESTEGLYALTEDDPWTSGTPSNELDVQMWEWAGYSPHWYDYRLFTAFKEILKAGIRQAVADVGYENLSGEAMYNAFQKLQHVNTYGNYYDVSWAPDRRVALSAIKIKQYRKTEEGMRTFAVTDWIRTTNIFEGEW